MNLRGKAQEVASKGRFGDSTLVHMHPAEVAGLASLAPGGKLPTNPDTGMPEAFFFLPFLGALGAGGAAAGAAGAGLGALGAGMTAGMTAASALPTIAGTAAAAAPAAASAALPAVASAAPAAAAALPAAQTAAAALPAAATAAETAAAAAPMATTAAQTAGAAASPMATTMGTGFIPEAGIGAAVDPVAAAAAPTLPQGAIATPSSGMTAATSAPQVGDLAAGLGPEPFSTAASQAGDAAAGLADPWGGMRGAEVAAGNNSNLLSGTTMGGPSGMMPPAEAAGQGGLGGLMGNMDLMQLAPLAMMMPRGGGGGGGDDEDREVDGEYKGGDAVFPGDDYEAGIDAEWDYFPSYAVGGLVDEQQAGPAPAPAPAAQGAVFAPQGYQHGIDKQWNYFPNGVPGATMPQANAGPANAGPQKVTMDEIKRRSAEGGLAPWMGFAALSAMLTGDTFDWDNPKQEVRDWRYGDKLRRHSSGGEVKRYADGGAIEEKAAPQAAQFAPQGYQHGISPQWNYFPNGVPGAPQAAGGQSNWKSFGGIQDFADYANANNLGMLDRIKGFFGVVGGGQYNDSDGFKIRPGEKRVKGYAAGGIVDLPQTQPMGGAPNQQQMMAQAGQAPMAGMAPGGMAPGGMANQGGLAELAMGNMPAGALMNPGAEQAAKGMADPMAGDQELIAQTVEAIQGMHPNPDAVLTQFIQTFGEAALQDLIARVTGGGGSPGGPVAGGGDGMSDSVPAMIDGTQPAALSQGEYVIPADVVSGLGNGSTDAGVKELDALSDKVRTMRNGGKVQPPAINPRKVMPM